MLHRDHVDDFICTFSCEKDAEKFLDFHYSLHHNIKITFEQEKDEIITSLDIVIYKTIENFFPSVFRKSSSCIIVLQVSPIFIQNWLCQSFDPLHL